MTVLQDIDQALDLEHVQRMQGIARGGGKDCFTVITKKLFEDVERLSLLRAQAVFEILPANWREEGLLIGEEVTLRGGPVLKAFENASQVAAVVCTVGPKLEKMVLEYTRYGKRVEALLLDGIGNAAVESLAQEVCRKIDKQAWDTGLEAGSPVSPGTKGFPLTYQKILCKMVGAGRIGVKVSGKAMMLPRKSISMIVGIGEGMRTWSKAQACARCNLRATCRYKAIA